MPGTAEIVARARAAGRVVLAFNVPYLPMVEPLVRAVADEDAFALIEVARLEWVKFEAGGPAAVVAEFARWQRPRHVRLHLDHVPVTDEDGHAVDYLAIIEEAIAVGYPSVMVDGSRLPLEDNIAATRGAVEMAHGAGVPCEAELGAVLGHEAGPPPDYEELFASGRGFTDVAEARRFVVETGCDWLSVAVGNVHGAIALSQRQARKVQARLHLGRLAALSQATGVPLVLHGGSGISREHVLAAVGHGIAKINIGTEVRQPYEAAIAAGVEAAQVAVYERARALLRSFGALAAGSLPGEE